MAEAPNSSGSEVQNAATSSTAPIAMAACTTLATRWYSSSSIAARTAGWVSHWLEQQEDPENRIGRPRQIYTGAANRDFVDIGAR